METWLSFLVPALRAPEVGSVHRAKANSCLGEIGGGNYNGGLVVGAWCHRYKGPKGGVLGERDQVRGAHQGPKKKVANAPTHSNPWLWEGHPPPP